MKIYFCFIAVLLCATAFAQTITYTTQDLTDPNDTDWKSSYPLFQSTTKPKAAETINMALQISDFKKCNTKKNPNALKRNGDADIYVWNFKVTRPTPRLIEVTTIRTTLAFGMQSSPYENIFVYHFDAETGDRIYPYQFFKEDMFSKTKDLAIAGLVKVMSDSKQRLLKEHPDTEPTELFDDTFEADCKKQMEEEWTKETVRINILKDGIVFIVNDCENYIPRRTHEIYTTTLPAIKMKEMLSPVWNYYVANGPKPDIEWVDHIWRGVIGTNIPVTIMLRKTGNWQLTGYEVYDNHGIAIPLQGGLTTKNVFIDEMDGDKTIASYFIEVGEDDVLTGSWIKDDNSKTLPVKAYLPK